MKDLVDAIAEESHLQNDNPQKKLYPWHMFSGGQATKSLILIFAWITSCISFYALSLNSADLKGNIFESFFYARSSAWGTIFVYLTLLTMGNYIQNWNWGRTKSLILSHFVLGCSCIILAYIPKKNEKAVLGVYMIGSIFASVSKYIMYVPSIFYGPKSFTFTYKYTYQSNGVCTSTSFNAKPLLFMS